MKCLIKSWKNFERIASLKILQLVSFWGVKIHFGEKYAWFAIEILIHGSKSCLWDVLLSLKSNQKIIYIQRKLYLVRTITIRGEILVKIRNVISENASFQGYFNKWILTLQKYQLSYSKNGYFFKILWWFHEAHYWVRCRWKNK